MLDVVAVVHLRLCALVVGAGPHYDFLLSIDSDTLFTILTMDVHVRAACNSHMYSDNSEFEEV